jgi:hypothetical protein
MTTGSHQGNNRVAVVAVVAGKGLQDDTKTRIHFAAAPPVGFELRNLCADRLKVVSSEMAV